MCGSTTCAHKENKSGFLAVSLGVDEEVSLQVHFQIPYSFATWRISDQSQFVEHPSTEVVRHNRETVIGDTQLKCRKENKCLRLSMKCVEHKEVF